MEVHHKHVLQCSTLSGIDISKLNEINWFIERHNNYQLTSPNVAETYCVHTKSWDIYLDGHNMLNIINSIAATNRMLSSFSAQQLKRHGHFWGRDCSQSPPC